MMIKSKFVYDRADPSDGKRILIMRKWPRGIGWEKNKIDLWIKEVAPSLELLDDWNNGRIKWAEYEERYFKEMESQTEKIKELAEFSKEGTISLLCKEKTDEECHRRLLRGLVEMYV